MVPPQAAVSSMDLKSIKFEERYEAKTGSQFGFGIINRFILQGYTTNYYHNMCIYIAVLYLDLFIKFVFMEIDFPTFG